MRFAPFKTLVLGFESRSTQLLILNPASPGKQRKKPFGRQSRLAENESQIGRPKRGQKGRSGQEYQEYKENSHKTETN